MMACLTESDLQGYLEESGSTPLRQVVESHLVSCGRCRAAFDRVVATHQRVNAWLSELAPPADNIAIDATGALSRVLSRIEAPRFQPAVGAEIHLDRLLAPAAVEIPWVISLYRNIHDIIRPIPLAPLEIASRPVAVKDIWGLPGILALVISRWAFMPLYLRY